MSDGAIKTLFDYFVAPAAKSEVSSVSIADHLSASGDDVETVLHVEVEIDITQEKIPLSSPCMQCNTESFRYAVSTAASNDPSEDRTCVAVAGGLSMFPVYDGHGGNLACDIATACLTDIIADNVLALGPDAPPERITAAIEDAYRQCDDNILREAQHIVNSNLIAAATCGVSQFSSRRSQSRNSAPIASNTRHASGFADKPPDCGGRASGCCWNGKEYFNVTGKKPERAGSCAVIALFREKQLVVSHVGDCRAFRLSRNSISATAMIDSVSNSSLDSLACSTPNHLRRSPRKKKSPATIKSLKATECTDAYVVTETGYSARCLTVDHCCEEEEERGRVEALTSDPAPFRASRGDIEAFGRLGAPMRVAGSLSVTRALGDGYLKQRDLSVMPYADFLPYISCTPSVQHLTLTESDFGLILASDGFWNNVNISEMLLVVEEEMLQHSNDSSSASVSASLSGFKRKRTQSIADVHVSSSTEDFTVMNITTTVNKSLEERIADALMKKCVNNAAASSHISAKVLKKMPAGQRRRDLIDDVTIMVILFGEEQDCVRVRTSSSSSNIPFAAGAPSW